MSRYFVMVSILGFICKVPRLDLIDHRTQAARHGQILPVSKSESIFIFAKFPMYVRHMCVALITVHESQTGAAEELILLAILFCYS